MTQQEILEYNKRCAEFLGFEISENKECFKLPNKNGWIILDIFHSDWNWIMEVVEAIEKEMKFVTKIVSSPTLSGKWLQHRITIQENTWNTISDNKYIVEYISDYTIGESKKEAVIKAINQFLIWYNENK